MYTYDDFVKEADKAGVMKRFSPNELATAQKSPEFGISLVGLLRDQQRASTAEQRLLATEAANQLRKSYGVQNSTPAASPATGAQDRYAGLLDQANAQRSFAAQPGQQDTRDSYAGLLNPAGTQGSFAYDPTQDPVWSSYKKQYAREGERASANAMAQAAAMSGGIPSSYAVTAGQQAGNYYAGQMSDIIPELEQNAYQRYIYEQQLKQQGFENALNLYDTLGYATPEIEQILGIGRDDAGNNGGNQDNHQYHPVDPTTEADLYEDMLKDLEEGSAPEGVDMSNFSVTNRTGNGWIAVGQGRMTWTELEREVNQGRIIEVVDADKGTITYKYAPSSNSQEESEKKDKATGSGRGVGGKKDMSKIAME